jgi:putative phage-type endonuclease
MNDATHTKDWHEERKRYICGSDLAALLGLSPWKSPLELWWEKTGKVVATAPRDPGAVAALHWGTLLEEPIAQEYARQTGWGVEKLDQLLVSPLFPHMAGHIDRLVVGAPRILECKTARAKGAQWGEPLTDQIPDYYACQCLHYLGLLPDREYCDLAALFGGSTWERFVVARNDTLLQSMWALAEGWWEDHVQKDIPPPPRTAEEVKLLYPRSKSKTVLASEEHERMAKELARVKSEIKDRETVEQALQDTLCAAIGESDTLVNPDGTVLATYKASKDTLRTRWEDLAQSFRPSADDIARYTSTGPGPRRFLLKVHTAEEGQA